jgi:serine/threonine-protein kinase SRPK3
VHGPNGMHLCIISQFAGPSLLSMSDLGWNKRLRGDLARKVAKQVATVVEFMHFTGFVHGGLSPDSHSRQNLSAFNNFSLQI